MHRLSHVHFTRWTPEGTQSTFRRRRALAKSMLSSTTTWVTLGDSRFSVSPPFFRICCWKIWYLAFPIPAGRMQTVSPLKVSPGITRDAALEWPNNWLTSQYCVLQLHWISVFHKKIKKLIRHTLKTKYYLKKMKEYSGQNSIQLLWGIVTRLWINISDVCDWKGLAQTHGGFSVIFFWQVKYDNLWRHIQPTFSWPAVHPFRLGLWLFSLWERPSWSHDGTPSWPVTWNSLVKNLHTNPLKWLRSTRYNRNRSKGKDVFHSESKSYKLHCKDLTSLQYYQQILFFQQLLGKSKLYGETRKHRAGIILNVVCSPV